MNLTRIQMLTVIVLYSLFIVFTSQATAKIDK